MKQRFIAGLILGMAAQCAAQTAPDAEQQHRLAEQKLRLVEMLVNLSRAQAISASNDGETAALVERSKQLLKQARQALTGQRYGDASQALDEALRSVSRASSRSAGALSDGAEKQRLREMTEQVAIYRTSLAELVEAKNGASIVATLERVDALAEEGRKLAAAGQFGKANKKMTEAYKLEVEELSRLRAGQVVVMSLKFETPADEYAYEQKRFQSNEVLVSMMIGEGRAEGDKRRLVESFLKAAAKLKEEAVALAQSNRHKDAVAAMEKAIVQLNRALQSMGVPIF